FPEITPLKLQHNKRAFGRGRAPCLSPRQTEAASCFSAANPDLVELVMKRIVQILGSALSLIAASAPTPSLNMTASIASAFSEVVEASRAHTNRALLTRAEFVMSTFDSKTVEAFGTAWRRSGNGSSPREGVVLI